MKTILIIDDDREISCLIRDTIEKEFKVLTVSTAGEGLRILREKPVSLVILDYRLPDMDGVETLGMIRTEHSMPVIMITAHGDKNVVLRSWKCGADFYFDKPFVFRELRDKVRELLEKTPPFGILGLDPAMLSDDIKIALEYIWENLMDSAPQRLNRTSIASATSLSPKYLSALFNRECGTNIFACINILRVERAKKLLIDHRRDIKEVAMNVGFKHSSSFSRAFRQITGKSPSFFKK